MSFVRKAIRLDPYTLFVLTDGGISIPNICQVAILRKKLISIEHIEETLFLNPSWIQYYGEGPQQTHKQIDALPKPDYSSYVAQIDSQVEFSVSDTILEKLQRDFLPVWSTNEYLDYLNDETTAVLVFLRVFFTDTQADRAYFIKGEKSSSNQIMYLYDNSENEISIRINNILSPTVSENRFLYVKDEILHLLKIEGALLGVYDTSPLGKDNLKKRLEAEREINKPFTERHSKLDNPVDKAQLDYDEIYDQVLKIAPNMQSIVSAVKNILPPQIGESDELFKKLWSGIDVENTRTRLIEMHLRMAVKTALNYHKMYGVDIEDAYQEASVGIIYAIDKYHDGVQNLIGPYVSFWMKQVCDRQLPLGESNFRFPYHYKEPLFPLMIYMNRLYVEEGELTEFYDNEIISNIAALFSLSFEEAKTHYFELLRPLDYDLLDSSTVPSGKELQRDELFENAWKDEYSRVLLEALQPLKERDQQIIQLRFGLLDQQERTLEEIGQMFGITRERIRQIESRILKRLQTDTRLCAYWEEMNNSN